MRVLGTKEIGREWMQGQHEGDQVRIISVVDKSDEENSIALVRVLPSATDEFRIPVKFIHPLDKGDMHPRDYCVLLSGPNRGRKGMLGEDKESIDHDEFGIVPAGGAAFTLCDRP